MQVLWVETVPAPNGWTGRAGALRAKLKEAVGVLLGQLYNRNCTREFAPPQAFQTEDLPPARFHSEVKTAAASFGGLMEARHTRVWSILTCELLLVCIVHTSHLCHVMILLSQMLTTWIKLPPAYEVIQDMYTLISTTWIYCAFCACESTVFLPSVMKSKS